MSIQCDVIEILSHGVLYKIHMPDLPVFQSQQEFGTNSSVQMEGGDDLLGLFRQTGDVHQGSS